MVIAVQSQGGQVHAEDLTAEHLKADRPRLPTKQDAAQIAPSGATLANATAVRGPCPATPPQAASRAAYQRQVSVSYWRKLGRGYTASNVGSQISCWIRPLPICELRDAVPMPAGGHSGLTVGRHSH
jgi:hypothetical protein